MSLNVFKAVADYLHRIVTCTSGLKALITDEETTGMVSVVYSVTTILSYDVLLTERLDLIANSPDDLKNDSFHHLTGLIISQPSAISLDSICKLLRTKRYNRYYIFFTNLIPSSNYLETIARADLHDSVQGVYEYYLDYYALTPHLAHINNNLTTAGKRNLASFTSKRTLTQSERQTAIFERDVSGILSILLSLKKSPDIRFASHSSSAQTNAYQIYDVIKNETDLFHFAGREEPALLLLLDRRDDPVTPLLTPWTYQSMLHQHLHLSNHRIDLKQSAQSSQKIRPELEQLVLSPQIDDFFRFNMFTSYGELAQKVKQLVAEYQALMPKGGVGASLDSMEALQEFVDKYPQYRAMSGNVSKHVAVLTELSHIINQKHLLPLSELEQEIVCGNAAEHDELALRIEKLILEDYQVEFRDKLRLVILYALRYENKEDSRLNKLKSVLESQALDERDHQSLILIERTLEYYSITKRKHDLFRDSNLLRSLFKAVTTEIKGVENIYTQHKPLLINTVAKLLSGDLSLKDYPLVETTPQKEKARHREIIIYMCGGITYDEYCALELLLQGKDSSSPPSSSLAPTLSSAATSRVFDYSTAADANSAVTGTAAPSKSSATGAAPKGSVMGGVQFNKVLDTLGNAVTGAVGAAGSMVGSATSAVIPKFNPRDYRIILAGSCIHNSQSFLHEICPLSDDFGKGKLKIPMSTIPLASDSQPHSKYEALPTSEVSGPASAPATSRGRPAPPPRVSARGSSAVAAVSLKQSQQPLVRPQ